MPNVFYFRHVILPGTLEHGTRNSGTPEHHGTFRNTQKKQEHPQENPEHLRRAGKVQNLKEIKLN